MTVVFVNALITTARSTYTGSTGITSVAGTLYQGLPVHIMPMSATSYKNLPVAALESDYVVKAESGTDIKEQDLCTSITLPDGVTPWPGLGLGVNANETFRVTFAHESTPGPLQHRRVYIARVRGGGVTY